MNAWSANYDAEEMLGAGRIECHPGTVWNSQRKGPSLLDIQLGTWNGMDGSKATQQSLVAAAF